MLGITKSYVCLAVGQMYAARHLTNYKSGQGLAKKEVQQLAERYSCQSLIPCEDLSSVGTGRKLNRSDRLPTLRT